MFTKTLSLAAAFAALASALPSPNLINRAVPAPASGANGSTTTSSTSASGTAAATGGGAGKGGVTVINNLNSTIYLWSVSNTQGPMQTLPPKGGTYSEKWRINPNGGGVSLKMSTTQNDADILQYEYTVADPTIYWDLSNVNLNSNSKFTKYGFAVTNNGGSGCPTATCAAGDTACADAYLFPTDDHATHGCPIDTDFTLTIGQ